MEFWQALIPFSSKSYNAIGRNILTGIFLLATVSLLVSNDLNEKENFRCNPNSTIASDLMAKTFLQTKCYMEYEKKYHHSVPIRRFVIINFGIMLAIAIVYVGIVNSKVEKLDTKTGRNIDDHLSGQDSLEPDGISEARIFVFPLYITHLVLGRILPLLLFILLIHPANFPVQFQCLWPLAASSVLTDHVELSNLTTVECINPQGQKFETLAATILWADCIIGMLALIEVVYLLYRYYRDCDFGNDVEFCSMYLLGKRNITIRQILKRIRKKINEGEQFTDVNLGFDRSRRVLANLHFRFLVQEEIESKDLKRHEIYNVHLKQDQASVKHRMVHLLPSHDVQIVIDNNDNSNTTANSNENGLNNARVDTTNSETLEFCGKILLTGRAGIGKTTFTKSIIHKWAQRKLLEGKVVILLRFRSFKKNKLTTLDAMLRQGEGIPSGSNFEELFKYILVNPRKIVLIFDGLDDIEVDCENGLKEQEQVTTNDYEEPMSMFTIYIKLLKDEFLPGATVVTTSRPSRNAENIFNFFKIQYETRLELLGFSERDIEDYVKKLCYPETGVSDQIWQTIENNPEFLSLCYIPEICELVCTTLKECFENAKTENAIAKFVPKTMTQLYQRAIRVIIWDKLKFKKTFGTRGYLTSDLPQTPENFMKTLTKLAKSKMESMEASFQLEAEDISRNTITCGLLTHLQDEYYCFLHQTMQEFLAACQIVDGIKDIGDVTLFFSSLPNYVEKPSWHLVVQFVVGLLGDKIRKKRINVPKESVSRSFMQWIRPLTSSNADKTSRTAALLVIKSLHEMQDSDMMKLCARQVDGLGNNCDLSGLSIAPIDCMALFQFLMHVRNLTRLNLTNNQMISDLGCLGLVRFLNENLALTMLNLARISVGDKGIKIICDQLNNRNRRLTNINLEINQITSDGIQYLCDAIMAQKINPSYLSLRSNKLMAKGAEILCSILTNDYCRITTLNISGNEIGNEGVGALCQALEHEKCILIDLNLGSNNITYEGVKSLCDVLKEGRCRITNLSLQRNNLTAYDIEPLRDLLKNKNCKLTKLDLSVNDLSDIGAECLYHGLTDENSCKLSYLNVASIKIKDRGVKILCDALKNDNCKLTNLDLSYNDIGNMGVEHLCGALKDARCKLVNLSIAGNSMSSEHIRRLCQSLSSPYRKTPRRSWRIQWLEPLN